MNCLLPDIIFRNGLKAWMLVLPVLFVLFSGCERNDESLLDNERKIEITKGIYVDNVPEMNDVNLNLVEYEKFLKYLVASDRYLIVTQEDFERTTSDNKVVISIRHDVDNNINGAIKLAYREHKYGIRATYYLLHTADYYGVTQKNLFVRNDNIIHYIKKLQNVFGHEIAFHNDLVTLQVVYDIDPRLFLDQELKWLLNNGISVKGSCTHGSPYCYKYHYLNTYFWRSSPEFGSYFYNYENIYSSTGNVVAQNQKTEMDLGENYHINEIVNGDSPGIDPPEPYGIEIIKDDMENYGLEYDGDYLNPDYSFSDVKILKGGKRWHMGMEDFSKIPAGKKVIILIHPLFWD